MVSRTLPGPVEVSFESYNRTVVSILVQPWQISNTPEVADCKCTHVWLPAGSCVLTWRSRGQTGQVVDVTEEVGHASWCHVTLIACQYNGLVPIQSVSV